MGLMVGATLKKGKKEKRKKETGEGETRKGTKNKEM
jgi:hypothetical protein